MSLPLRYTFEATTLFPGYVRLGPTRDSRIQIPEELATGSQEIEQSATSAGRDAYLASSETPARKYCILPCIAFVSDARLDEYAVLVSKEDK